MELEFLGTGTSTGVPQIGCRCNVCTSTDPHDRRLRASAILRTQGKSILIDCGPDFREQILRASDWSIDAVLITHIHYDHIGVWAFRNFKIFHRLFHVDASLICVVFRWLRGARAARAVPNSSLTVPRWPNYAHNARRISDLLYHKCLVL